MQKFIITKKKDISERNERENINKYKNIYHKGNFNHKSNKNKNKVEPSQQIPYKYTEKDMEIFIDELSGQMPRRLLKRLKKIKPKIFSSEETSYKLVKDWRVKWKKKPHLTDEDYKILKTIFDTDSRKLKMRRMVNKMIDEANIENAEFPHKKFIYTIVKIKDVIIDRIEIKGNNDTSVFFKYRGNDVVAICYGKPFEDKPKFLPTKLIINGQEEDISRKNIKSCIKLIKPKIRKIVVVKKKGV